VYVPEGIPVTVVLVPVPVAVTPPGLLISVHVPETGNPLNPTLPVDTVHVGVVIIPTVGAAGVASCALITTFDDEPDTHPAALVTVKVYVPAASPDTVVLTPVPVVVTAPGLRVNVQVPVDGKPLSITLPVATVQVGWVIVPTVGAEGVALTVKV
jgi:hypothetical protein